MTTEDIKDIQILLTTHDGQVLIGTTTDSILAKMIASYVKFVKVDASAFTSVAIKDLITKQDNR